MKKYIAIAGLYAGISCGITNTKKERIIGYYNPEIDKKPDRNQQCICGSGIKFKKCCIYKK